MKIIEIPPARLDEYARVSIGFWVNRELRVEPVNGGLGGLRLVETRVEQSYFNDYDAIGPEVGPIFWPRQFDVSRWAFFLAYEDDRLLGGAAVSWNTAGVNRLAGRSDLAVLWDIRVQPDARGLGTGAALFQWAEAWARNSGCWQMKIETQNINVDACRFYARMGCTLGEIDCYAYAAVQGCENEVMLCWYKDLM